MKRILIISRDIHLKQDGGTLVSKRNERLLQKIGFETTRFIIPIPSIYTRLTNMIFRQSYGSTALLLRSFKEILDQKFDYIFFDGSIYGGFLRLASKLGNKTVCFYHNVEAEYYRQKACQTKSFADKLMIPYIRYNERISTTYSDYRITLNNRDSQILISKYGKAADAIIPTSFPNRNIKSLYDIYGDNENHDCYLLFVGTNFFANYEGLNHFIVNIAPQIKCIVNVVGNIEKAFESRIDIPDNVRFVGRVDNLAEYYIKASAVLVPILSGSGLKTKTVEALSYGKTVIGFPEAFEGIGFNDYPGACLQVENDGEFINAINHLDFTTLYNPVSAKLFQEKLSDDAQVDKLKALFDSII